MSSQNDRPAVTVVMPAFNTEGTIAHSIASVLAQTRRDFELIVVDDGSTDRTGAVVSSSAADPRVRLVRQENRGVSSARNRGVAEARGRLISFLDSDDLLMPTYLDVMAQTLEEAPHAGFAYTDAWVLDHRSGRIGVLTAMGRQRPPLPPPADPNDFLLALLRRNFVYTAVMVRREVLEDVGTFREDLRASIDYEMSLRIVAQGYAGVRAPGLLAIYRQQRPGSIRSDLRRGALAKVQVMRIITEEYALHPAAREIAQRRYRTALGELAALDGAKGPDALWRRSLRPALGRLRARVKRRRLWLEQPSDEVAAAFPWLVTRPSGNR